MEDGEEKEKKTELEDESKTMRKNGKKTKKGEEERKK